MIRALRWLGSPRLGLGCIAAFAVYAALGSLPLFQGADGARVPLRQLAWIDRSEGEYFAWWPGVGLLVAIVVNMTLSMLTRVPRTWAKAPVFLTHAGVLLLALGSALYAAQKQEGEVLLLAPGPGQEIGPAVREMLDRSRVGVTWAIESGETVAAAEVGEGARGLPRYHAMAGDARLRVGGGAGAGGEAWTGWVTAYAPGDGPEGREGSKLDVAVEIGGTVAAAARNVVFSRHAPTPVQLGDGALGLTVAFTPLRVAMPGVSLALRDVAIELVPGSEVERNVVVAVRTHRGEDVRITLNEPLTLEGLEPPSCDCLIRGPLERLWHRWINPVRWKFSIAGWDHDGWLTSREASLAGITERPRAGFVILGVGTVPGVRIISAGAMMLAIGAAWAMVAPVRLKRNVGAGLAVGMMLVGTVRADAGVVEVSGGVKDARSLTLGVLSETMHRERSGLNPVAPLRTLPVQWNGRVAPLDTVARDVVRAVSGRERVRGGDGSPEDPLVTLVGLMCDPEGSAEKPLLSRPGRGGGLISVREAESLLREQAERVQRGDSDRAAQASVRDLAERLGVLRLAMTGLALVAPDSEKGALDAGDWMMLDDLRSPPTLRAGFEELARAWRSGDAAGAYAAASRWAGEMRSRNHGRFEQGRVWGEALINAVAPLGRVPWVYGAAAVLLFASVSLGWVSVGALGGWVYLLGLVVHTTGFACRWWIAGRVPIQNQYESMLGLSLAACAVAGVWPLVSRGAARGGVVLAGGSILGAAVLAVAHHAPIPGRSVEPEAAILGTAALLKYHVATVLVAYGFIALGGILGAAHLLSGVFRRGAESEGAQSELLRPLLKLAFWTLTAGILLGALWADRSWGRWWAFDPKETWALITWTVYLFAVHLRAGDDRPASRWSLAWAHVLGTLVMVWTWFGVNLLLPGLHAYAGSR